MNMQKLNSAIADSNDSLIIVSVSVSIFDVASSKIKMAGSNANARANEIIWRKLSGYVAGACKTDQATYLTGIDKIVADLSDRVTGIGQSLLHRR